MSYWDTVNLYGLAALEAKSTNPKVFTPYIAKIAAPSPGAVVVHDFAQGKAALAAGKKIRYSGAVGDIAFDQWRNSIGEFEIVNYTGQKAIRTFTAAQVEAVRQ
jgi:hypothetical protein